MAWERMALQFERIESCVDRLRVQQPCSAPVNDASQCEGKLHVWVVASAARRSGHPQRPSGLGTLEHERPWNSVKLAALLPVASRRCLVCSKSALFGLVSIRF